jgi:hypothetical protein
MSKTINTDIIPVALIGQYEQNNILYPAAQILNNDKSVFFDPAFVAGSLVSLYEAFLSHVPESKQLDFEKNFKWTLMSMLENKERYTIKINDHDNQ